MSDSPEGAEAAAPASGGSKVLPILVIVNTLLVGGVLFFVMKKPAAPAAAAAAEAPAAEGEPAAPGTPAGPPVTVRLDNFVIQLRALDAERYIRVAFEVEVNAEPDKQTVTERTPQIRDAVIAYFSDRTVEELRGSEGMERTKQALLKRMEQIVPGRRVRGLYITEFIMQ